MRVQEGSGCSRPREAQGTGLQGDGDNDWTSACAMRWAEGDAVQPGFNWEFSCNRTGARNPSPPVLYRGQG